MQSLLLQGGEEMPQGFKRAYNDIFYLRKEHFCPSCHTKLEKVSVSRVVNSRSPEAKDFDFRMAGGTRMIGDVRFTWDELECPKCKRHLTVKEMKEIEGIPVPEKPSRLSKILWYVLGLLIVLALTWLRKYLS